MLCYILCCTHPYKDLLVTSYICNICNLMEQRECKVNNYVVRSYRDVIVLTNIATRRTSKAQSCSHVLKFKKSINKFNRLTMGQLSKVLQLLIMHTQYHRGSWTADHSHYSERVGHCVPVAGLFLSSYHSLNHQRHRYQLIHRGRANVQWSLAAGLFTRGV